MDTRNSMLATVIVLQIIIIYLLVRKPKKKVNQFSYMINNRMVDKRENKGKFWL